jgi:hypothetical protein
MIADPLELSSDLCMRNMIQTCLDYKKPMSMVALANQFLSYVFKSPKSVMHQHILMGL